MFRRAKRTLRLARGGVASRARLDAISTRLREFALEPPRFFPRAIRSRFFRLERVSKARLRRRVFSSSRHRLRRRRRRRDRRARLRLLKPRGRPPRGVGVRVRVRVRLRRRLLRRRRARLGGFPSFALGGAIRSLPIGAFAFAREFPLETLRDARGEGDDGVTVRVAKPRDEGLVTRGTLRLGEVRLRLRLHRARRQLRRGVRGVRHRVHALRRRGEEPRALRRGFGATRGDVLAPPAIERGFHLGGGGSTRLGAADGGVVKRGSRGVQRAGVRGV